uniref:Uncharacterized protein n=1 Tax=Physcomitrium patens TaxID=3218 RepID=A0A2K1JBA5_PHYPA|nr:hypothetical protein PHYPA_019104 [Physcomitrium patens]
MPTCGFLVQSNTDLVMRSETARASRLEGRAVYLLACLEFSPAEYAVCKTRINT